jgi:hypothetical protein
VLNDFHVVGDYDDDDDDDDDDDKNNNNNNNNNRPACDRCFVSRHPRIFPKANR